MKYYASSLPNIFLLMSVLSTPHGMLCIFRGRNVAISEVPYHVAVIADSRLWCNGAIISEKVVVTTAHCLGTVDSGNYTWRPFKNLSVLAGSDSRTRGYVLYEVSDSVVHPYYGKYANNRTRVASGDTPLHDIGVLQIRSKFQFNSQVAPIRLTNVEVPEAVPVVVTGWGSTESENYPQTLQYGIYKISGYNEALQEHGLFAHFNLYIDHPKGQGICVGDSGAPAVVNKTLVGIASFALKDCGKQSQVGYVKILAYRHFLHIHKNGVKREKAEWIPEILF